MVVGPAAVIMLRHNQTLILIRSHRVLTHGIAEDLSVLPYVWIGEIVVAIILEGERPLRLTVGQVLEAVHTRQFKLAVAPLDGLRRCVVGQFLHVGLEFGTTACPPENVGITVGGLKHAGVDTADALDILRLGDERSFRTVGDGDTDAEAPAVLGC